MYCGSDDENDANKDNGNQLSVAPFIRSGLSVLA